MTVTDGDAPRASLDAAIEAFYDDVRTAIRRRGATQTQATEVVHDLYLRLSGNPNALANARSLKAILVRAAINLGIDRERRQSLERRLFTALDTKAYSVATRQEASIEWRIDRPKRLAYLRKTILELPPQCRNVFVAHRMAGMSKDEIASTLGIQRRMVDRHLRNALLHCLEKMDEFDKA